MGEQKKNITLIYIDQNILQYVVEGKLKLPDKDNVFFVFSNEHFNEIKRYNIPGEKGYSKKDFFRAIDKLNSLYMWLNVDENFNLHENVRFRIIIQDSEVGYNNYVATVNPYENLNIWIYKLAAYLLGDEHISIEEIIVDFDKSITTMLSYLFMNKPSAILKKYSTKLSRYYIKICLKKVLKQNSHLRLPLIKLRRKLTSPMLSCLNRKNGKIVEQIWALLKEPFKSTLTMDEIFGKKNIQIQKYLTPKYNRFYGIIQCHNILNTLGYFPDEGINKRNKVESILSDGTHIANGMFCNIIVSADERFCKKAEAIYDYFDIPTRVIKI